jgi:Transcriptional regulator C-terminal region
VYRALCGRQGGALVQRYLRRLIGDLLRKHLRPHVARADVPAEVAAEFYTSAALGLLVWWIDHDFCNGPDWLTSTYRTLATRGEPVGAERPPITGVMTTVLDPGGAPLARRAVRSLAQHLTSRMAGKARRPLRRTATCSTADAPARHAGVEEWLCSPGPVGAAPPCQRQQRDRGLSPGGTTGVCAASDG